LVLAYLAILALGLYLGLQWPPAETPYGAMPSALFGLSPAVVEAQVEADFKRLQVACQGLGALQGRIERLQEAIKAAWAAQDRSYYTPGEEDRLRWFLVEYLAYRKALLRIVVTFSGYQSVPNPAIRARCFLLGYTAALTLYKTGLKFVHTCYDRPAQVEKLNEAEPAWGIPAGVFDRIYESVGDRQKQAMLDGMTADFDRQQRQWRQAGLWPREQYGWLEGQIRHCLNYVQHRRLNWAGVWLDRMAHQVRWGAYTPAYALQSMVAHWIGHTRLIQDPSNITLGQIHRLGRRLRPGDILLVRRNWFLSNAFLPGFWPHAALYVGTAADLRRLGLRHHPIVQEHWPQFLAATHQGRSPASIEALSEGVIFNSNEHTLLADYVAVLRPRLPEAQIALALIRAFRQLGKPYDFEFDFSSADKLICTEVIYRAYEGMLHFRLKQVMGRNTLPADELVNKFAAERRLRHRDLDFVEFLDAAPAGGRAVEAGAEELCASVKRSSFFTE
jgi:hypothetical protein